jgi:hypothetical protein
LKKDSHQALSIKSVSYMSPRFDLNYLGDFSAWVHDVVDYLQIDAFEGGLDYLQTLFV